MQWKVVQQCYFEWLRKHNTGKKWATALIQKVWEVLWDMWDHRNKVRLKTITPAEQQYIMALNALVMDGYERGTSGLRVKDQHWLVKPKATNLCSTTTTGNNNGHNRFSWHGFVFSTRPEHKASTNKKQ
jgi:hypothetical protein